MEVSFADMRPKDQAQLNVFNDDRSHHTSPQHLQYSETSNSYSRFSPSNPSRVTGNSTKDNTSTVLAAALPQTRSAKRWNKVRAVASVVNTSKERLQASFKSRRTQSSSSAMVVASPRSQLLNPKLQLQRLMQPTEMKRKRNANKHYKSQLAIIQEENRDLLQQYRMEKMDFSHQRRELEAEVERLEAELERARNPPSSPEPEHDESINQVEKEVESGSSQRIALAPKIAAKCLPTDQAAQRETSRTDAMKTMSPILQDTFTSIISEHYKEEEEEGVAQEIETLEEPSTSDPDPKPSAQPLPPQAPSKDPVHPVPTKIPTPKKDTRPSVDIMLPKDPITADPESIAISKSKEPVVKPKPLRIRNTLSRARMGSNPSHTESLPPMETSPKDPLTATSLALPRAVPLIRNNHNSLPSQ